MTTLPQTTPMRLPRPAGGGQLAIPNVPQGGPIGAPAGTQMTGGDVWRVFRSNWWLITGLMGIAAVIGYFVNRHLALHHPKYTASGLIKVELAEEVFNPGLDNITAQPHQIELELKTQSRGLMQPKLFLDVLTDSDRIRNTEWFREHGNSPEDAKEDLVKNLTVTPFQLSRLITIEMTYRKPTDARLIVEEIVDRYIRDQQDRVREAWSGKAQTLEAQLDSEEREYRKVTDKLTAKTGTQGSGDSFQLAGMVQIKQYELGRLTDSRQMAESDLTHAENSFKTLEALITSGETPPEVESVIFTDQMIGAYQAQLDELDGKMARSTGAKNPSGQGLAAERQALQQKLEDRREVLRNAKLNVTKFELQTKMETARQSLNLAEQRITLAEGELRKMQASLTEYTMLQERERTLKQKVDVMSEELEKIQQRRLPSSWAPVSWFTKPPTPETPSFPKLPITMAIAVLSGLALSLGIAFLREMTDTSVRSPRDIARVGNLTLLGMIPHEADDPQAAGARIPLVIFDAPHSMAAEEFRKLRTRLQHAAALDSTRSILVSSANPQDGKTTVACNLAAGLALNGRRILLVDANFRRPEIHNIFEVSNEQGFCDALNDPDTLLSLVRDTPVQNLHVLPTGPKPVNATELLESQLLIDFIERALEDYDHVIFDSGPLLIVSETMALAPRVDGVVTVVRARTNSRGVLGRMRDMLRQVKAEHLGVVLNAVRSQGGGYYGRNIKTYYAYQNS